MAELSEQIARMMRESVNASAEAAVKFQEHTWKLVDELVQRGAVAKEEGKKLLDAWTRRTEEFQERMEEKYRKLDENLRAGLKGTLPPTRKELDELNRKLDQLMLNLQGLGRKQPQRKKRVKAKQKTKAKAGRKRR
ncbi:MAG: hypothetical protein ACE5G5_09365 [Candidatus Methylomirabilales bacterium]